MIREITPEKLRSLLPFICDKETSQDPDGWAQENPMWGHCAVVSLVAQNLFGGELLRASLAEVPGFAHMRSHYWNQLPDGSVEDFTKPQFGDLYPSNLQPEVRARAYVLSFPETVKRYKLLAFRLTKTLYQGNPLFDDPMTRECFEAALDSPCQKMKFGCVVLHQGNIIYRGCNKTIEPLRSLCEPTCIRLSITSRTEQMLGACGHAEEWALTEVTKMGVPHEECELYIFGLYSNGLPWLREAREHTCLRCATQMYRAGIKHIFVAVIDAWERLNPEEAVRTALAYALRERAV